MAPKYSGRRRRCSAVGRITPRRRRWRTCSSTYASRFGLRDGIHDEQAGRVQPGANEAGANLGLVAEQDGPRHAFVGEDGGGALDDLGGAVGKDDPKGFLARPHHEPPHHARARSDPHGQALLVRHVVDRPAGHAVLHRLACNGRRLANEDPRIDGLRQQVLRPEAEPLVAVRPADFVDHFVAGQIGQRPRGSHQHPVGDPRRLDVEGAAEDVRKAQVIDDRVGKAREAGRHDHVAAACSRGLVADLGFGRRHREHDGEPRHRADHLLREHAAGGRPDEHVGAPQPVLERARRVRA